MKRIRMFLSVLYEILAVGFAALSMSKALDLLSAPPKATAAVVLYASVIVAFGIVAVVFALLRFKE